MTPKSRNLGEKGKTVQKSHTGKRYPNLEIFDVKWSLKYLEANGENQLKTELKSIHKLNLKENPRSWRSLKYSDPKPRLENEISLEKHLTHA